MLDRRATVGPGGKGGTMLARRGTVANRHDTDVPLHPRAPSLSELELGMGGEQEGGAGPSDSRPSPAPSHEVSFVSNQHEVHAGHLLGAAEEAEGVAPLPMGGTPKKRSCHASSALARVGSRGRSSIFGALTKATESSGGFNSLPRRESSSSSLVEPGAEGKAAAATTAAAVGHRGSSSGPGRSAGRRCSLGRQSVFQPLKKVQIGKLPASAGAGSRRPSAEEPQYNKAEMARQMSSTVFQEHAERGGYILDPDWKAMSYWYCVLLLVLAYNALVIPYRIAFSHSSLRFGGAYAIDIGSDAVLLIEIFITFRRGYYEQSNKVMDPREIRRRYVRNLTDLGHPSLLRDVVSILPLDLLQIAFGMHGAWRLPRLLRTPRIFSCMAELGARVLSNHKTRIVSLVVLFVLLAHYIACAWWLFGVLEGFGENAWLPQLSDQRNVTTAVQYVSSMYHSLGMMVGVQDYGQPERVGEGVFHIAVMVTSLLVFAYAIGVVSTIEESNNERALKFQARMQYVQLVLRHHKLSRPLVDRVTAYLEYQFNHQDDFDLSILEGLPEGLQTDVMRHVTSSLIKGVPLFRHVTEEGFFPTLTTQLAPVVFMRHETLILEQSHNDEMFFLVRGEAMELRGLPTPHLHRRLGPGDYCGENMLLRQQSTSSVVAHTPCECFVLKAHKLREVLAYFPNADEALAAQVQQAQEQQQAEQLQKAQRALAAAATAGNGAPAAATAAERPWLGGGKSASSYGSLTTRAWAAATRSSRTDKSPDKSPELPRHGANGSVAAVSAADTPAAAAAAAPSPPTAADGASGTLQRRPQPTAQSSPRRAAACASGLRPGAAGPPASLAPSPPKSPPKSPSKSSPLAPATPPAVVTSTPFSSEAAVAGTQAVPRKHRRVSTGVAFACCGRRTSSQAKVAGVAPDGANQGRRSSESNGRRSSREERRSSETRRSSKSRSSKGESSKEGSEGDPDEDKEARAARRAEHAKFKEQERRRRSSAMAAGMASLISRDGVEQKKGFWSFLIWTVDAPRLSPGQASKVHGMLGVAEPLRRLRFPLLAPRSRFRAGWIVLTIVCVLYTDLTLLYRLGFMANPHAAATAYVLFDGLTDFVFVVDLLLPFRTAYWRHTTLVTDVGEIAARYVRTSFALHLTSVLPLLLCIGWAGVDGTTRMQPWLRTPLLLRTFQVPYLIDEFAQLRANSNFSAKKLVKLLYIFVALAHGCAAGFGIVTQYDRSDGGGAAADAALAADAFAAEAAAEADANASGAKGGYLSGGSGGAAGDDGLGFAAYVRALWWAVTALTAFGTIETPQTVAMKLYSIGVLGFSLFTSVYMIGNIGVLIGNLDAAAVIFRKKKAATDLFAKSQGLPPEMSTRLHLYQQCVWTRGAGQNLQAVVQQLNPTIRSDIMQHICHSIFITVPLFRGCGPKFIASLMEAIHLECFPQGEWVCRRGSIATAMYIVMKGSVNVVIDEVKMVVVKRLSRGDFFGERSLFGAEKRNASIQAKTTVELVLLRADRFRQVLNNFPEVKRSIEEAKKRREAETEAAKDLVQTFQPSAKEKNERNSAAQKVFARGRNKAAAISALGGAILGAGDSSAAAATAAAGGDSDGSGGGTPPQYGSARSVGSASSGDGGATPPATRKSRRFSLAGSLVPGCSASGESVGPTSGASPFKHRSSKARVSELQTMAEDGGGAAEAGGDGDGGGDTKPPPDAAVVAGVTPTRPPLVSEGKREAMHGLGARIGLHGAPASVAPHAQPPPPEPSGRDTDEIEAFGGDASFNSQAAPAAAPAEQISDL